MTSDHLRNQPTRDGHPGSGGTASSLAVELSVVMPCLNELDTVGPCVDRAIEFLGKNGIPGEVIVADNGSTDGSVERATERGARVVHVAAKGYGNALMGGIEASRGRYLVMLDADGSYDIMEAAPMVVRMREGADIVLGCRLPWGGGKVMPGAMPPLHRWVGNPLLTRLARLMFRLKTHDIYCGMRGFTRELYDRLALQCTGMEFATEMIIKSRLYNAAMAEVPIILWPDGRQGKRSHLRTFRDGWRTVRFYLLYSPSWLFLAPATLFVLVGLVAYALVYLNVHLNGARLDAHTLLFASLLLVIGHQLAFFWMGATVFAVNSGLRPAGKHFGPFFQVATLDRGIMAGALSCVAGIVLLAWAVFTWRAAHFGDLDYSRTMRLVVPGVMLTVLGLQTVLSSFFISMLGLKRRTLQI